MQGAQRCKIVKQTGHASVRCNEEILDKTGRDLDTAVDACVVAKQQPTHRGKARHEQNEVAIWHFTEADTT